MSRKKKKQFKKLKAMYQKYWPTFLERYYQLVPEYVIKTISKVLVCGTEALGCHIFKCPICGFAKLIKHSCKTRFCSTCATAYIDKWAAKVKYWLSFINADYYFVTFTIPKKLEMIVKANKRLLYNALFKSASYAILSFYKEKRVIGGIIAIIHIVGRTLNFHPHIHLLCTYGGLLFNKLAWKEVFLPAKVLQGRFKQHFLDTLRTYYKQGKLEFPEDMHFESFAKFNAFLNTLARKHWQIKRKGPMDAVTAAIEYIARYLGKPPMSENRILWHNCKKVCFTYKDYLNKAVERKYYLTPDQFFLRLMHAVPLPRFPMVRFYGLFSTRKKGELLKEAAKFIPPPYGVDLLRCPPPKTMRQHRLAKTGTDPLKCPNCNVDLEEKMVYYPGSLNHISFEELLANWQKDELDNSS